MSVVGFSVGTVGSWEMRSNPRLLIGCQLKSSGKNRPWSN